MDSSHFLSYYFLDWRPKTYKYEVWKGNVKKHPKIGEDKGRFENGRADKSWRKANRGCGKPSRIFRGFIRGGEQAQTSVWSLFKDNPPNQSQVSKPKFSHMMTHMYTHVGELGVIQGGLEGIGGCGCFRG